MRQHREQKGRSPYRGTRVNKTPYVARRLKCHEGGTLALTRLGTRRLTLATLGLAFLSVTAAAPGKGIPVTPLTSNGSLGPLIVPDGCP